MITFALALFYRPEGEGGHISSKHYLLITECLENKSLKVVSGDLFAKVGLFVIRETCFHLRASSSPMRHAKINNNPIQPAGSKIQHSVVYTHFFLFSMIELLG